MRFSFSTKGWHGHTFEDFCDDCDTCCLNCAAFPKVNDCEQAFDDFVNGKLASDFIREEWGIL